MKTLYEKRGRRYIPVYNADDYHEDRMRVGTFRLTYAYQDGSQRYAYEVTPDTAGFVAAAEIAALEMERKIKEHIQLKPSTKQYTKEEYELLNEFKKRAAEIGFLFPTLWNYESAYEIVEAAIQAVRTFKP